MTDRRADDLDPRLRAAIHEAADAVEPTDRLAAIRQGTRASARSRRRAWYAAGGGLVAAAAVAALAVVVLTRPGTGTAVDPAGPPSATSTSTVYYVGPGPDGPQAPAAALYVEEVEAGSVLEAVMTPPRDPDYRTAWPTGSLVSYEVGPDEIAVVVGEGAPLDDDLALQQLVHTLQAHEDSEAVLSLTLEDSDAPPVDVARGDDLDVLSHMSITTPAEGTTYAAGTRSFTATGQGNSFEAGGGCFLRGDDGVEAGAFPVQMSGWLEPRLFPWEITVDLTDVPPGSYVLACITDDPTGGAEGRGTDTDTRTVIVE